MRIDAGERERIEREAHEAAQALEDPAWRRAVETVQKNLEEKWKTGETTADREAAHFEWRALHDVLVQLQTTFKRGEALRKHDEQQASKRKGRKRP